MTSDSPPLTLTVQPLARRYSAIENIQLSLRFRNVSRVAQLICVPLAADFRELLRFDLVELTSERHWEGRVRSPQSLMVYRKRVLAPGDTSSKELRHLGFRSGNEPYMASLPPGQYVIRCDYDPARAQVTGEPPMIALMSEPAALIVDGPR